MNAFGKRNGLGAGQRPQFGVARPMKVGRLRPAATVSTGRRSSGSVRGCPRTGSAPSAPVGPTGAMDRLNDRQNASGDRASSKSEGFEASVHRIKEQVLPRLLERVDPEAAATLGKDELAEDSARSSARCWPS